MPYINLVNSPKLFTTLTAYSSSSTFNQSHIMVYWLQRHLLTDLAQLSPLFIHLFDVSNDRSALHRDREVISTVTSISTTKDAAQMLNSEDDTHTYTHT